MSHYVKTKIERRILILWDPYVSLLHHITDEWEFALDAIFLPSKRKFISNRKKEIKMQQKRCLDYLGISDKKLLNKLVRHEINKILDSMDKTEEAIKSNAKIYEYGLY